MVNLFLTGPPGSPRPPKNYRKHLATMIDFQHHTQSSPSQPSAPTQTPAPSGSGVIAIHCEYNSSVESHRSPRFIRSLTVFDGQNTHHVPWIQIGDFLKTHQDALWLFRHAAPALECLSSFVSAQTLNSQIETGRIYCLSLLHQLAQLGVSGEISEGTSAPITRSPVNTRSMQQPSLMQPRRWGNPQTSEETFAFARQSAQDLYWRFFEICQTFGTIQANASQAFGYISPVHLASMWNHWGPQTHHLQLRAEVALRQISRHGLHVDPTAYQTLLQSLQRQQESLTEALRQQQFFIVGSSITNLQRRLGTLERDFPDLVLPRDSFGNIRTSDDDLSPFRHARFIDDLLNHRSVTTLLNSLQRVDPKATLHPTFHTLTRTGRTSSFGEINAQGIPRQGGFRRCFVPSRGHVFIGADFGQIELRSLAAACEQQFKCSSQLKIRLQQGNDLHRALAAGILRKPVHEVTSEERQRAKAVNFGCPAGMGAKTLVAYARTGFGVELTEQQAQEWIGFWHATFPEVAAAFREHDTRAQQLATLANLSLANHAAETGDDRLLSLASSEVGLGSPNAMLGGMAFKVLGSRQPSTREGRLYPDSDIDYFWDHLQALQTILPPYLHDQIKSRTSSWQLARSVSEQLSLRPVLTLSGRLRQAASPTARRNTIFQGLAADGAKLALWELHKAGFRTVNFIHDEVLIEVPETVDIHVESEKIRRIMIGAMAVFLRDVPITVNVWAARSWDERAESVRDGAGWLQLWEPPEATERTRERIQLPSLTQLGLR